MAIEPNGFVHLHLHTDYSLLDGANRIDRLMLRIRELGMDAVAITDHGNLFGAAEFYTKAVDAGIKPILGIETYVAPDVNGTPGSPGSPGTPGDRRDRTHTGVADGGLHLVLLAEDQAGWRNLLKLSSDAYLNGFYYRPRTDKATLARWSQGLIALNGHLGSSLAHHLGRHLQSRDDADYQRALAEARWHRDTFGANARGEPRFFLELQRNGVPEQEALNRQLVRLARDLDIPLVCDNDAHFLLDSDHDAHDTLCCISMGKTKQDPNRLRYSPEVFVRSAAEMAQRFEDHPEAIANTRRIADRCNVKLDFGHSHAPVVKIERLESEPGADAQAAPAGSGRWYERVCARFRLLPFDAERDPTPPPRLKADCDRALRELAEAGAVWRYGPDQVTGEIRARLDRELGILAAKNISAYFLIVWDFVNEARRRGIPATARGSGVGTMVGYCLGLSNACPVRYGLLFERFTDPDRSEFPDIDIDICQDGRQAILDYVRRKYGHVAQIITFGTLKARAAIRDVGRVLEVPLADVDRVCKLVGDGLGVTIDKALQQEPDLRRLYDESPTHRQMLDAARRLEGLARHAGVHAAGVVIATEPLDNLVPLYQPAGTDQLVTQWDGPTVEHVGLLKMDFLGLRTLSIIERTRQLVRRTLDDDAICAAVNAGPQVDPLDLERLRFDDQAVFDLFRRGETAGVFQFESGGMRNTLMGMKPDRIEDLIAANALFRPGPMELIADYNDRKQGRAPVPPVHPIVDRFTAETYGIMVYQEQVMQIVHELGGIALRDAYSLIKAISKKKSKVIDADRPKFIAGAQARGLAPRQAGELFDLILKFAGYGFNKSHSTGYAIVAYQTAYLKTYYPVQYMAALLTYESVSTEKVVEYIDECRRVRLPDGHRGIEVRPPDVNRSDVAFTVVFDNAEPHDASHGHIRFGLGAVKGVGEKAVEAIIGARQSGGPFRSLYDFCERVPLGTVNRVTIEALIKCGAFDTVHGAERRAAMLEAVEPAIQAGQSAAADRDAGQLSFFEDFARTAGPVAAAEAQLPDVTPWTSAEQLRHEKAVLGFFVSSDPLTEHQATLQRYRTAQVADLRELAADTPVVLGGMLGSVRTRVTQKGRSAGQKMAILAIADHSGSIEAVVFAETYAIAAPLLEADRILFLKGHVDRRREEPSVVVDLVIPLEQAAERLTQTVKIVLCDRGSGAAPDAGNGALERLKQLLRQSAASEGGAAVLLEVRQEKLAALLRLDGLRVRVDAELPRRIDAVLDGDNCCQLLGADAADSGGRPDGARPRAVRRPYAEPEPLESGSDRD